MSSCMWSRQMWIDHGLKLKFFSVCRPHIWHFTDKLISCVYIFNAGTTLHSTFLCDINNETLRRCINKLIVQNRGQNQNSTSTPHYDNTDSWMLTCQELCYHTAIDHLLHVNMLTSFPQCIFSLEFPQYSVKIIYTYIDWVCLDSEKIHCQIIIDMPCRQPIDQTWLKALS